MRVRKQMEHDVSELRSRRKQLLYRKREANSNRGHMERQH